MRHILYKIKSRHFSWQLGKSYKENGDTEILRNINGFTTIKLYSKDFRRLANDMDNAGIKSLKIISINGELYLGLNE